jgi:hypothetical protein
MTATTPLPMAAAAETMAMMVSRRMENPPDQFEPL